MARDARQHSATVRDQAAQWVFQLHTTKDIGPLLPVFRTWLDAAPEHRQEYCLHEMIWQDLADLQEASLPDDTEVPDRKLTASACRQAWIAVCAAALVLAGLALAFYPLVFRNWVPVPCEAAPHGSRGICKLSAGQHSSGRGQGESLQLVDGSEIVLGSDSEVTLDIDGKHRQVRLDRGEARFTVAPDATVPFDVKIGGTIVKAVGGVFSVESEGTDRLKAVVEEGIVSVLDENEHRLAVRAGQIAEVEFGQVRLSPTSEGLTREIKER